MSNNTPVQAPNALVPGLALVLMAGCVAYTPASNSSITGAVRLGNQAVPALRICALAQDAGTTRCVRTRAGQAQYRIEDLTPGRYHVMGWLLAGELRLIAHATSIRCIRAPCPSDRLRDVELPAGAQLHGIDLDVPYTDVPAGWPPPPE